MKAAIILLTLLNSHFVFADHYDNRDVLMCKVSKMLDFRYFQEALSEDEYPHVDVAKSLNGEYTVGIGGNYPYEKSAGDRVEFTTRRKAATQILQVKIRTQFGDLILLDVISPSTGGLFKGQIRVQEKGELNIKPIANITCQYKP